MKSEKCVNQLFSIFSQNHKIQAGKQILKIDIKWLLDIFGKSCNCIVRTCSSIRLKLPLALDFNRMCSRTFSFQNGCITQSLYSKLLCVFVSVITIAWLVIIYWKKISYLSRVQQTISYKKTSTMSTMSWQTKLRMDRRLLRVDRRLEDEYNKWTDEYYE